MNKMYDLTDEDGIVITQAVGLQHTMEIASYFAVANVGVRFRIHEKCDNCAQRAIVEIWCKRNYIRYKMRLENEYTDS